MEHKPMWSTKINPDVIRLANKVGLQPYYDSQEQAIEQFYFAIKNEHKAATTMNRSKYIVVKKDDVDCPVLFPSVINHDTMFKLIGGELVSAGFCTISCTDDGDVNYDAYGKSVTLNVTSRRSVDSQLMNIHFNRG
jgi:hypothetical protein